MAGRARGGRGGGGRVGGGRAGGGRAGGGRGSGGGRSNGGAGSDVSRAAIGAGSSSHSSNPSSQGTASVSRTPANHLPDQYPNFSHQQQPPAHVHMHQQPPVQVHQPPPPPIQVNHPPPPLVHVPQQQLPPVHVPQQPPPPVHVPQQPPAPVHVPQHQQQPPVQISQHQPPFEIPDVNGQIPDEELALHDHQRLLDELLAHDGRQSLPLLSPDPNVNALWFNHDKGKLVRVIADIFRRKFDGPYYSWKRKYNWELGITELVKQQFTIIAKKRMKGIVSQVRRDGRRPIWIGDTLWRTMSNYWETDEAVARSENASACCNSQRGGFGRYRHVSGQKSYLQIHQEMEEELKRPVSFGEVFLKAHTRGDGSFVDEKAKYVNEVYEKNLEERASAMDVDELEGSDSSQQSTQRTLTVEEKNEVFLQSTEIDRKGNKFGLGRLAEVVNEGHQKESYGSSSSSSISEQLKAAHLKIAEQEVDNARRESRIASLEMIVDLLKSNLPEIVAQMDTASARAPASVSTAAATTARPAAATTARPAAATHTTPASSPDDSQN